MYTLHNSTLCYFLINYYKWKKDWEQKLIIFLIDILLQFILIVLPCTLGNIDPD